MRIKELGSRTPDAPTPPKDGWRFAETDETKKLSSAERQRLENLVAIKQANLGTAKQNVSKILNPAVDALNKLTSEKEKYEKQKTDNEKKIEDAKKAIADQDKIISESNKRLTDNDATLSEDEKNALKKTVETAEAAKKQQEAIVGLLQEPDLLEGNGVTKERWVEIMRAAGFDDEAMLAWHQRFEEMEPDQHQKFLESLGIETEEIERIRNF